MALGFLVMVAVLIALDPTARISLYVFPGWALILVVGFRVLSRRNPAAVHGDPHGHLHAGSGD